MIRLPDMHRPRGCPDDIFAAQVVFDVPYWGFDHLRHTGVVVVNVDIVDEVRALFALMCDLQFPLESVRPINEFGWDDDASMAANNTSGFNYRMVNGTNILSPHAHGLAIDINPRLNPCVNGTRVFPPDGVYVPGNPGVFTGNHQVIVAAESRGWTWGGRWINVKDYHHLERKN